MALVRDGVTHKGVNEIASLGSHGRHSGNVERDYHRWMDLGRKSNRVSPYTFYLTLRDESTAKPSAGISRPVSVFLPYEYVHLAHERGEAVFGNSFVGPNGSDELTAFWQNAMEQPWGQRHPHISSADTWGTTLPILWHYDGVVVHNASGDKTELAIFSFSSRTARANTHDTRFPVLCVYAHMLVTKSFDEIATLVSWIMETLASGRGPHVGLYLEKFETGTLREKLAGRQFAGGWRGILDGC